MRPCHDTCYAGGGGPAPETHEPQTFKGRGIAPPVRGHSPQARASIMPGPSPRSARHNEHYVYFPSAELRGGPPGRGHRLWPVCCLPSTSNRCCPQRFRTFRHAIRTGETRSHTPPVPQGQGRGDISALISPHSLATPPKRSRENKPRRLPTCLTKKAAKVKKWTLESCQALNG